MLTEAERDSSSQNGQQLWKDRSRWLRKAGDTGAEGGGGGKWEVGWHKQEKTAETEEEAEADVK